jgi:hypothetical protein
MTENTPPVPDCIEKQVRAFGEHALREHQIYRLSFYQAGQSKQNIGTKIL